MQRIKKIFCLLLVISALVCTFMSTTAWALVKTFPNGTYEVGKDIPVGDYTIEPINGAKNLRYEIYKGSISKENLYEWMLLDQQRVVHLTTGEYLEVKPNS